MKQRGSISGRRCKRIEEYMAMKIRTTTLHLWNMFVVYYKRGMDGGRGG
jgi:hypothetical protein